MFQQKKGEPFNESTRKPKKGPNALYNFKQSFRTFFFHCVFWSISWQTKTNHPLKKTLKFHQPKQDPQVVDPPRPGLHHVVLRALRWVILGSLFLRDVGSHKVIGMFPKIRFFYTFYIHLFIGFGTINYKPSIFGGFLPLFLERPI